MCQKKFAVCVESAARLGIEPSPFASEAAVLETARAATHLRAKKVGLIRLSPKPYLPSKGILESIKQRGYLIGITHCIMIGAILLAECF